MLFIYFLNVFSTKPHCFNESCSYVLLTNVTTADINLKVNPEMYSPSWLNWARFERLQSEIIVTSLR